MKKSFLTLLVLSLALTMLCSCAGNNQDSTIPLDQTPLASATPNQNEPSASPSTNATEGSGEATPTPEPTATPSQTPNQNPGTEPEDGEGIFTQSGSIRSDTGTSLNMRVDWTATQKTDGDPIVVTVKVYLDCYSLSVRASEGNVIVNGTTIPYNSERIAKEEVVRGDILLTTVTQEISNTESSLTLGADWNFRGVYSGVPIDVLAVNETITLNK